MRGKFHINWEDFTAACPEKFGNSTKEFSDVTLVSSDGKRIPGHIGIWVIRTFFNKKISGMERNPAKQ